MATDAEGLELGDADPAHLLDGLDVVAVQE